jgi:hypothetical protein
MILVKRLFLGSKYLGYITRIRNTIIQTLKGLGHEIRIALKWYGLIGLG